MNINKEVVSKFLETRLAPLGFLVVFTLYLVMDDNNEMQTGFYLLILLPGLLLLPKHYFLIFRNTFYIPVILFLIFSLASLFWRKSHNPTDFLDLTKITVYIITFSMMVGIILKQQFFLTLCKFLSIIAAGSALYSLYHFYIIQNFDFGARLQGWGNLTNPLRAATVYGYFSLTTLLGFLHRQYKSRVELIFYSFTLFILCFALLLTFSRTPIGAFFITSLLIIFLSAGKYRKTILAFFVAGAASLVLIFPSILSSLLERGLSGRLEIWSQAYLAIKEAPMLGYGINSQPALYFSNTVFNSAHNRLLSTIYYTGITGGLLLIAMLVTAFWPVKFKMSLAAEYAKYLLLFGCLCSLTEGKYIITRPDMVWLIFWLPLSVLLMEKYYHRQTLENCTKNGLPSYKREKYSTHI